MVGDYLDIVKQGVRLLADVIVLRDNPTHFEVELRLSLGLLVAHLFLERKNINVELADVNFVMNARDI